MNLFALDLPTPISEKVAVVRPYSDSSPHRDLILIDLSANVNSRILFGPFTVTPPRLVGPDQSPIFEPEAACSYIEDHYILARCHLASQSCQLASGPSVEPFVLNLRSNQSGHGLIVAANSHLIIRSCAY